MPKVKCNRTVCNNEGTHIHKYIHHVLYCAECASKINYWSKRDNNEILCTKDLTSNKSKL